MELTLHADFLAICRLDASEPTPDWAAGAFVSITRTDVELSIVCDENRVPDGIPCERSWRWIQVKGILDFSLVGIIAGLTSVLADAGISVFVVSSFDTDVILVKQSNLQNAIRVLENSGHSILR